MVDQNISDLQDCISVEEWQELLNPKNFNEIKVFLAKLVTRRKNKSVFNVAEHFTYGTQKADEASIVWLNNNFKNWFLPLKEEIVDELTSPVFRNGGGQAEKQISTMKSIYELLFKHAQGEKVNLLLNGHANIFYVYDSGGVLRKVYVSWGGAAWRVDA